MSLSKAESERRHVRDVGISQRVSSGESPHALAVEFGLCFEHVQRICKRLGVDWAGRKVFRKRNMALPELLSWIKTQCVEDGNGCQIWTGFKNKKGYPRGRLNGKLVFFHRVVAENHHGKKMIPGECALHSCDHPSCLNPHHLWIGTNDDNVADREAKGRNVVKYGENHVNSKLTNRDVVEIRDLLACGRFIIKEIEKIYDCTSVCKIKTGVLWSRIV